MARLNCHLGKEIDFHPKIPRKWHIIRSIVQACVGLFSESKERFEGIESESRTEQALTALERASLESTAIEDGVDVESAVGLSDKECKLERRQKGRIRKVSFLDVDLVSDGPFWEPDS